MVFLCPRAAAPLLRSLAKFRFEEGAPPPPLSPLLPGLHRNPRLALSSNSAGRNYFTQVRFAAYFPPPLLVALFVFGGCKSPNLIWLPALRTTAAAAPAAAAQA